MKKVYAKPILGNANQACFEDAYTCNHSGAKTGGCSICGTGYNFGGGFNFGGGSNFGGSNNYNWGSWWSNFFSWFNSWFKK